MLQKFRAFLRRLFSRSFVHPVFNEKLNTVIDDKIRRVRAEQETLSDKYNNILNGYLKTYFTKKYSSQTEMAVAYQATNKEWKKLCRTVNGKEKLINIDNKAFERQVKLVVSKTKENEAQKEKK